MKLREEALADSRKAFGTENTENAGIHAKNIGDAYESSGRYAEAAKL